MKYAIYSDGSYKNGIWGAGAVILQETPFGFNPVQELSFYGEDADGIRNVAGEIYGVLEALRLLFKINQSSRDVDSVTVYHDYEGLQKWADGEWKAKRWQHRIIGTEWRRQDNICRFSLLKSRLTPVTDLMKKQMLLQNKEWKKV